MIRHSFVPSQWHGQASMRKRNANFRLALPLCWPSASSGLLQLGHLRPERMGRENSLVDLKLDLGTPSFKPTVLRIFGHPGICKSGTPMK